MKPQFKVSAVRTGSRFWNHFSAHTHPLQSSLLSRDGSESKQQPASLLQGRERLCSLTKTTSPSLLCGKVSGEEEMLPGWANRLLRARYHSVLWTGRQCRRKHPDFVVCSHFPVEKLVKSYWEIQSCLLYASSGTKVWCEVLLLLPWLTTKQWGGTHGCLSSTMAQSLGSHTTKPNFKKPECGSYSYPSTGKKYFWWYSSLWA